MFGLFSNLTAVPITGILLAIVLSCTAFVPPKTYRSPDRKVKAIILSVGKKGYEELESRIEIRSAVGRLYRLKGFASADGEHGFGVTKARWTPNSQFFIFGLANSGGHQPWHQPIYFYSLTENQFYCLDDYVGPITSAFSLTKSNGISTTRLIFPIPHQQGVDEKVVVYL